MKLKISRNELFFIAVYFVQAVVGISSVAQFLYTRNELKLDFIELGLLGAIPIVAWSMKPIYGFITDLVPIYGYRRKIYLHIMPLVTMASWLVIWKFGYSFETFAIPLLTANIGLGFTDVICDGLVVENSTKDTVGKYQTLCWGSLSIGAIVSSFFSGFLIQREIFSIREMFLITAFVPLITFALSFTIKEIKNSHNFDSQDFKVNKNYIYLAIVALLATIYLVSPFNQIDRSISSLLIIFTWLAWVGIYFRHLVHGKATSSAIFYAALFLFLWRFTPSFGAPWEDFYINQLHIDPEKYGFFGIISYLGWFLGSMIYIRYLDKFNLKKLLTWTVILSGIVSFSQLLIATPSLGENIGNWNIVKYFSLIITTPIYLLAYGSEFIKESLGQYPIINLEFSLNIFLGILYMVSFLPLQKLAALSTPKNFEGTNFAIMASVMNLGLMFGQVSGGMIYERIQEGMILFGTNFTGIQVTVFIGAITTFLCLSVIGKIKVEEKLV